MEMFLTIKLCTYAKLELFSSRTDYLHENGFGVKITYKGWYAIKPNKPNILSKWFNCYRWGTDKYYHYESE